jgi:hypothetical protein
MIENYGMGTQLIVRGDGSSSQELSEETRSRRDREQQALVDEAQWEARCIVVDNRALLDEFAAALLSNETLDRHEIDLIMARYGGDGSSSEDSAGDEPAAVSEAHDETPADAAHGESNGARESVPPPPNGSRSKPPPSVERPGHRFERPPVEESPPRPRAGTR